MASYLDGGWGRAAGRAAAAAGASAAAAREATRVAVVPADVAVAARC